MLILSFSVTDKVVFQLVWYTQVIIIQLGVGESGGYLPHLFMAWQTSTAVYLHLSEWLLIIKAHTVFFLVNSVMRSLINIFQTLSEAYTIGTLGESFGSFLFISNIALEIIWLKFNMYGSAGNDSRSPNFVWPHFENVLPIPGYDQAFKHDDRISHQHILSCCILNELSVND